MIQRFRKKALWLAPAVLALGLTYGAVTPAVAQSVDRAWGRFAKVLVADGTAAAPSITFANDTDTGFYRSAADTIDVTLGAIGAVRFSQTSFGIRGTLNFDFANNDLFLVRDAANTLALRNGTSGQAFRLYDSYTNESTHTGWELNADTAGSFLLRYRNNGAFSTVGTFTSGGFLDVVRLNATQQVSSGGLIYPTGTSRASVSSLSAANIRLGDNNGTNSYDITLADWGTTQSAESVSVAVSGLLYLGAAPLGSLFITVAEDNSVGQVSLQGAGNTASVVVNAGGVFTATKDTANRVNVYYDAAGASGAGYYIQNTRAATRSVRTVLIGG